MNTKNKIQELKNGECFVVPESDYGKAEVWYLNGIYFLFEIPTYGGLPRFVGHNSDIDKLLKVIDSWT